MSAIVIDLSKRLRENSEMRDQHAQVNRIRKRERIEARIQANKQFSPRDARILAEYVSRLLAEATSRSAQPHGLRSRIAEAVWGDRHFLKRFDQVTIKLGEPLLPTRLGRLAKKPRAYVKVVRALSIELGRDPQDTIVDMCAGTSLDADLPDDRIRPIDDQGNDWQRLTDLFVGMTQSIVDRAGLGEHQRLISTRAGAYRIADGRIDSAQSLLLPHGALAGNYEVMDEYPPIPSVVLFQELRTPLFQRTLHLSEEGGQIIGREEIAVDVAVWREVRLAIGPADDPESPRPLFEIRTRVEFIEDGDSLRVRWPWFYIDEGEAALQLVLTDGSLVEAWIELGPPDRFEGGPVSCFASSSWVPPDGAYPGLDAGPDAAAWQPEHVYAAWQPVNEQTCKRLFDRPFRSVEVGDYLVVSEEPDSSAATMLPEASLGGEMEKALLDDDRALERKLEEEARRIVTLVSDYVASRRGEALIRHDETRKRWLGP